MSFYHFKPCDCCKTPVEYTMFDRHDLSRKNLCLVCLESRRTGTPPGEIRERIRQKREDREFEEKERQKQRKEKEEKSSNVETKNSEEDSTTEISIVKPPETNFNHKYREKIKKFLTLFKNRDKDVETETSYGASATPFPGYRFFWQQRKKKTRNQNN